MGQGSKQGKQVRQEHTPQRQRQPQAHDAAWQQPPRQAARSWHSVRAVIPTVRWARWELTYVA